MKATYIKPETKRVDTLMESYLMAGSQGEWAESKENPWGMESWGDDEGDTSEGSNSWGSIWED